MKNGGSSLIRSVHSMLHQDFEDIEIIVVLNGSDIETQNQIKSIKNSKIKILELAEANITSALNLGISSSDSEFIARQDADDWSSSDRIGNQIKYLRYNKSCAVVGTSAYLRDEHSNILGTIQKPSSPADNRLIMNFENTLIHSSTMIRRQHLTEIGLYKDDGTEGYPEDLDLWLRILNKYEIANLPLLLHNYTLSEFGLSRIHESENRLKSINLLKTIKSSHKFRDEFNIIIEVVNCNMRVKSNKWNKLLKVRDIIKSLVLMKNLKFTIRNKSHRLLILKFVFKVVYIKFNTILKGSA